MRNIISIIAKSLLTAAIALSLGTAIAQPAHAGGWISVGTASSQHGPVFDGQESHGGH